MKIAVFEVEEWEKEPFHRLSDSADMELTGDDLSEKTATNYADVEIISTFIYSVLNAEVLKQLPKLRLIATRSTGFDHIDEEYCRARGITVCNVPEYGSNTVAEHVFGLLLTISHRLEEAVDRTRKGDFSPKGLQGFDLEGRTLGVIGTGGIGLHVIQIANGFGMHVIAFDLKPNDTAAGELGFNYVTMSELLTKSDVITVHVPANPKTKNLLDDNEFRQMKDGCVLINTSRGDVVNIRALVRALAERKVRAAGLDVLPDEPVIREEAELLRSVYEERHDLRTLLANHVISQMRNVIVTPHSAFNTREAVQRILDTTVANINSFIDGDPANVVI